MGTRALPAYAFHPHSNPQKKLSPRSDPLLPVLTGDCPGVGISTYRQGDLARVKTRLLDTLIPRNTPENGVSGGSGRIIKKDCSETPSILTRQGAFLIGMAQHVEAPREAASLNSSLGIYSNIRKLCQGLRRLARGRGDVSEGRIYGSLIDEMGAE